MKKQQDGEKDKQTWLNPSRHLFLSFFLSFLLSFFLSFFTVDKGFVASGAPEARDESAHEAAFSTGFVGVQKAQEVARHVGAGHEVNVYLEDPVCADVVEHHVAQQVDGEPEAPRAAPQRPACQQRGLEDARHHNVQVQVIQQLQIAGRLQPALELRHGLFHHLLHHRLQGTKKEEEEEEKNKRKQ